MEITAKKIESKNPMLKISVDPYAAIALGFVLASYIS
jgi:hypothetical protein